MSEFEFGPRMWLTWFIFIAFVTVRTLRLICACAEDYRCLHEVDSTPKTAAMWVNHKLQQVPTMWGFDVSLCRKYKITHFYTGICIGKWKSQNGKIRHLMTLKLNTLNSGCTMFLSFNHQWLFTCKEYSVFLPYSEKDKLFTWLMKINITVYMQLCILRLT